MQGHYSCRDSPDEQQGATCQHCMLHSGHSTLEYRYNEPGGQQTPIACKSSSSSHAKLPYLSKHPHGQDCAEPWARKHPEGVAGAAVDVQREQQPGQAHSNDVQWPQWLFRISLSTVDDLGHPEAETKQQYGL